MHATVFSEYSTRRMGDPTRLILLLAAHRGSVASEPVLVIQTTVILTRALHSRGLRKAWAGRQSSVVVLASTTRMVKWMTRIFRIRISSFDMRCRVKHCQT